MCPADTGHSDCSSCVPLGSQDTGRVRPHHKAERPQLHHKQPLDHLRTTQAMPLLTHPPTSQTIGLCGVPGGPVSCAPRMQSGMRTKRDEVWEQKRQQYLQKKGSGAPSVCSTDRG